MMLVVIRALGNTHSPIALEFLQQQLEDLSKRKQVWRTRRNHDLPDLPNQTTQECAGTPATLNRSDKQHWQYDQWEIE